MQKKDNNKRTILDGATHEEKFLYLLEEYKMLRTEIESYSQQKRRLETGVATGLMVIYAWVSTTVNLNTITQRIVLILPIIITGLAILRFSFYNMVIRHQINYVRSHIESKILGEKDGWEAYWASTKGIKILRSSELFFWSTLFLLTIFLYFIFTLYVQT